MTAQERPPNEGEQLLANAVLTRDHLRAERDRLQQTLSLTEARLDVVLEMLAMLEGRTEQATRVPPRQRRRTNSSGEAQGTLPTTGVIQDMQEPPF